MLESRTVTISIDRPWREVYEAIWRPEAFQKWASGLSQSSLWKEGEHRTAEGPDGRMIIQFTEHNAFGVMDHYLDTGSGLEIYVPLRIIANGDGAEVLLTLFRQPGMSDEKFAADVDWVARDLGALQTLMTRGML